MFKSIVAISLFMASQASLAETKFGAGADFKAAMSMTEIMKTPDKYLGKEVTFFGTITDVCAKRGCWMKLSTDYKGEKVRIKVQDGVMVFPLDARGKKAVAKGEFKKFDLSIEDTKAYLQHMAEENKQKFDPASVKAPMTVYQVNATGAVIE